MSDMSSKLGKIFIGGLSYETTDDNLRSYFSAFGPVTDAVVMKDPISRRSRGFGFITYADPVCVDRALAQPNHILDSRRVEAKRAVPRSESISRDSMSSTTSSRNESVISSVSNVGNIGTSKKIFVGGLHYETKDAEFRRYFQAYGKVISAEVMFNRETNKSRGFGFVIFEQESSVDEVLKVTDHVIDGKMVEVKRAVPRTDIPPPRSVSSRASSFTGMIGTGGPGSVGSVDDVVSIGSTASISRSCTPSSSLSASGASSNELSTRATTNISGLSGYAAAVRYGDGSVRNKVSDVSLGIMYHEDEEEEMMMMMDPAEKTLASVADALTSLVLDDDETTVSSTHSGATASPIIEMRSPLGITPRPLSKSLREEWNLSPAIVTPQPSPAPSQNVWQARSWQKGWAAQADREDEARASEDPLATTPSYFSAFAESNRRAPSAWSTSTDPAIIPLTSPSISTSNVSGTDSTSSSNMLGNHSSNSNSCGRVGSGTFGGFRSRPAPYNTLGAFFPPEYLSSTETSLETGHALLPNSAMSGGVLSDLDVLNNSPEVLRSDRHVLPIERHYR